MFEAGIQIMLFKDTAFKISRTLISSLKMIYSLLSRDHQYTSFELRDFVNQYT